MGRKAMILRSSPPERKCLYSNMADTCVGCRKTPTRTGFVDYLGDLPFRESALTKFWNERQKKRLLAVDLKAQQTGEDVLKKELENTPPTLRGEESSLESIGEVDIAALLDMLDGTDLLQRDLGKWCSALVLFSTREPARIITAAVGVPDKEIYYTDAIGGYVRLPRTAPTVPPT